MLRKFRGLTVASILLVMLGIMVANGPVVRADSLDCPKQSAANTDPDIMVNAKLQPLVVVHGWIGNSASMGEFKTKLDNLLNKPKATATLLDFDYQAANFHWASNPQVAACLADYLHKVSAAHHAVGGSDEVLVVAHSMGGLAVRFATDKRYTSTPADDVLAGVVTLDTPFKGSPFGNQVVARALEVAPGWHLQPLWPFPKAGTDGSICLALHSLTVSLPSGCDAPPYLPVSAPLTQIAGDVSISRSLFGIHLYDIDLASDGIVSSDSSQGYLESGPSDTIGAAPVRAKANSQIVSRPERCTMSLDQVAAVAAANGLMTGGGKAALVKYLATINLGVFTDLFALDELSSGQHGLAARQLLLGALFGASCSHTGILTFDAAVDDTATALRGYIQEIAKPTRSFAQYKGSWGGHGRSVTIDASGHGEMSYRTYNWCTGVVPDSVSDPSHPCERPNNQIVVDGGHASFQIDKVTSADGDTVHAILLSTNDPSIWDSEISITWLHDAGPDVATVQINPSKKFPGGWTFCDSAAQMRSVCGA